MGFTSIGHPASVWYKYRWPHYMVRWLETWWRQLWWRGPHCPRPPTSIYHILIVTNINFVGKENHSTRRKMILTIFYHHVKGDFKDGKMAALCWAKFNTDCGQSIIIMPRHCPKCVKLAWQRWPCDEPSDYPALSHRASQFIVFVCHGFNEYCSLLNIETIFTNSNSIWRIHF